MYTISTIVSFIIFQKIRLQYNDENASTRLQYKDLQLIPGFMEHI
jgi:hypothetical protein